MNPNLVNSPLVQHCLKFQTVSHSPGTKDSSVFASVSSPRCSELDQAFLTTPFPVTNSPNLMDKINLEMAQRNAVSTCKPAQPWYTSYTPANIYRESLQPINESYRKAVCGGNAISAQQQPTIAGDGLRKLNQPYEHGNISIEGGEDINMPCPPQSLKFDISSSSNNESMSSTHSSEYHTKQPAASTTEYTSSDTCIHTRPSSKFTSPSNKIKHPSNSSKSPGSKLSIRMKATTTARKRYDYSATLGIGESLMQAQSRLPTKLASPSRKLYSHSACLGMTSLERASLQNASKKAHPKNKSLTPTDEVETGVDHSSSMDRLCDLYSPKKRENNSSYNLSRDLRSPDSPAPALLKILETNVHVAQSQKEKRGMCALH